MGDGNNDNLQALGWNAHRHPSSPIAQPRYRFQDVEKCHKSLEGSVIQEVPNRRESFKVIMAEMVLLCTEAIKRSRSGRTAAKPLSLEYIADRLDVDDPCFGYLIRSDQGHLQGFITVTTFTNWQKSFCWDSLQEMSFYYDDNSSNDFDISNNVNVNNNNVNNDNDNYSEGESESDGGRKPAATTTPMRSMGGEADTNNQNTNKSKTNSAKKKATPRRPRPGERIRNKKRGKRSIDEDGSLAKRLENTVRSGDPYDEGIVWPRIAEISLLGALGCGRILVQLVIEQLEFQRATSSANYDYIVLQATDNSIPFYESLGFVRVGAVCYDTKHEQQNGDTGNSLSSRPDLSNPNTATRSPTAEVTEARTASDKKTTRLVMPETIVSSPNFVHEVVRPGESPNDIAKQFKICVWDIIFLNKDRYPDMRPTSRLKKGTELFAPKTKEENTSSASVAGNDNESKCYTPGPETPTKWFVAKENDTPRKIAKHFGIACNKLVSGNRRRLPELQATSRLRAGTRVKVSNLDQHDTICEPYCHWSFPEDTGVEGGDPSYMMVYKLDRKTARNPRTVRDSLAVPVGKYSAPTQLFPPPPKHDATSRPTAAEPELKSPPLQKSPGRNTRASKANVDLKFPKEPKRPEDLKKEPPKDGKQVYWDHQKILHPDLTKSTPENEKIIRDRWSRLGNHKKEKYHGVAAQGQTIYNRIEREYNGKLSAWKNQCDKIREEHELEVQRKQAEAAASKDRENSLFSKVIKLRDDALEGKDYKYWFVLTFIPDLKWCHLAPMVKEGYFGPDRRRSHGRPRYRLVDEKLFKELDISSSFCILVKSKALKRTADADKEEWDILDGPVALVKDDISTDTSSSPSDTARDIDSARKTLSKEPKFRARTSVKPLNGKIALGVSTRHAQDPLKRTRGSPASFRKRRLEEVRSMEKPPATKIASPARERKRRRCMRCINNDAPLSQAIECLGAKGRYGRDACEYFGDNGIIKNEYTREVPVKTDDEKEATNTVNNAVANFEKSEVTSAPPSPRRPSRRPDTSGSTPTSAMRPAWTSPARKSGNDKLK